MNRLPFYPTVDIPLTIGLLALFLLHYQRWANKASEEIEVDLLARLPRAKFRITLFLIGLLTICWLANFGVWAFVAILMVLGTAVTFFLAPHQTHNGPLLSFMAAVALREWSFGFPSLILDIPNREPQPNSEANKHELIGAIGKTSGPLKPTGYIRIDNIEVAVIADDGLLIDADSEVVVTGFRNGCLRVKTHQASPEN